jgi:lantibiotic biosynthesis protein
VNVGNAADWAQSLADGVPGIALVHIERARAGQAGWEPVHQLARQMTPAPVQASPLTANLFYGAPAVAYALHAAGHPAYRRALAALDASISTLVTSRLTAAHRRIDAGLLAQAREYDLISGLAGLGAYLLHRHHDRVLLRGVLGYLTRLTLPVRSAGEIMPGWWAAGSPDRRQSPRWDDGHSGFGIAHGIAGPLAVMSIAMRRGVIVSGQAGAIRAICAWLGQWRITDGSCSWWPEVISRDELRAGSASRPGPHRPSWCYGSPGIVRAQHLAGLALGEPDMVDLAEETLTRCLADHRQLAQLTDPGLCHGQAGLLHTARRAHADSPTAALGAAIETAADWLQRHRPLRPPFPGDGLLSGTAGITLARETYRADSAAANRWDACLLTG